MSTLVATTINTSNLNIGSNVYISNNGLYVGNASVNVVVNTTSIYVNGSSIANSYVRQAFTGTGACTTFTVTNGYTPNNLDVYINGVRMVAGSVNIGSGSTIVFSEAPENGAVIEVSGVTTAAITYTTPNTSASYNWSASQVFGNNVTISGNVSAVNITGSANLVANSLNVTSNVATIGTTFNAYSNGNIGIGNTTPTDKLAINGTVSEVTGVPLRPLVIGTAQNTTSGTYFDYTGIPSWVRRITISFNGVSTSGSSFCQVQIGSGSIVTSGYSCGTMTIVNTGTAISNWYTSGFVTECYASYYGAAGIRTGHMILTYTSTNNWIASGTIFGYVNSVGVHSSLGGYATALSGTLDRIRLTTINGSDTFDAGQINILYE